MKIAYIIDSVLGGGATSPVPAATRVLRDAGAEVEVFALQRRDGMGLPAMIADGLKVHVRDGGKKDNWAAYRWLSKELSIYKPTLIWTSLTRAQIIGSLLGWRRKIPVVAWQHMSLLKPKKLRSTKLLRKIPIMWVGDSDVVTKLTAERFDVPAERLACWPIFYANPDAPQAKSWQKEQALRIGSLGRLRPMKGYDVLIKSLALLQQRGFTSSISFEIEVAGEGSDRELLLKLAKQAGLSNFKLIRFTEKPYEFLATLHLYIQPSQAEGLCVGLHEAMQAGLPVIASSVGQMPYTVEQGKSGWLVPPNDVEALANALTDALLSPEQLATMGKAARKRVLSRYSKDAFRNAGESVLERVTKMINK